MATITAGLVKELRDKTGAGMMDCKKALGETDGDLDAAVDWLRKKGLAAAQKKSGRTAAEGLVGLALDGNVGALVEINSETDFVARNDQFQSFVAEVGKLALTNSGDVGALGGQTLPSAGKPVSDALNDLIATIGENMTLRRSATVSVDEGVVAGYVHTAVSDGLGRIGVIVGLSSTADAGELAVFGKQLAMHIAAARPESVSVDDLDQQLVERERLVLSDQARASGKPEEIIAKMVEGRLRKFYQEVVLSEQTWVLDGESTIKKVVDAKSKELGAPISITGFARFGLGEGVDKQESDFASEVAATLAG